MLSLYMTGAHHSNSKTRYAALAVKGTSVSYRQLGDSFYRWQFRTGEDVFIDIEFQVVVLASQKKGIVYKFHDGMTILYF